MEECTWGHRIWTIVKRLILVLLILFCIGIGSSSSMPSEPVASSYQK